MALTRNRLIGNLANATDSAASSSFLAKGATEANYQSIAYSDVTGKPTILDSAGITSIIDSSYIQARQGSAVAGLDSAGITSLIDSNYVVARAVASGSGYGRYNYTATAGQTVFQDSDNSGAVLSYTSGGIMVFYNGVMLKNTADWEGTDGSSVTLVEAADSGANVSIHKWTVAGGGSGGSASFAWGGDRAIHNYGASSNDVTYGFDYVSITTPGNSADFGNMNSTGTRSRCAACGSSSRGIFAGGQGTSTIEYVTPSTLGNGTDFGASLSGNGTTTHDVGGASNGTLGLFAGGYKDGFSSSNATDTIEYITIATTGTVTDFGNLANATYGVAGAADATRALFAGGYVPSTSTRLNAIEYFTIATPSNGTNFGNLTVGRSAVSGASSTTIAVFMGGAASVFYNNIDYVTIQNPSNATDFGDLTIGKTSPGTTSDGTYAITVGGGIATNPYATNIIDYITIATPSNATDFGDCFAVQEQCGAVSGSPS